MVDNDKEIKELIKSIIFTIIFLVMITIYWFNIRPSFENNLSIKEVTYNDIYVTGDVNVDFEEEKVYQFKVVNISDITYNYTLSLTNNYLLDNPIDYSKISYSYQMLNGNFSPYLEVPLNGNLNYGILSPHNEISYAIKISKSSLYKEKITGKIVLIVDQEALAIK